MGTPKKNDDPGALVARPSFIESSTEGTDDIEQDDIKLPRLCIAQGLSAQMIPDDPMRIEGLQLFDFFNDLTNEVYRRYEEVNKPDFAPLVFVPVKRQVKRIRFDPEDRRIPLQMDVPTTDPGCKWTTDPDTGERKPPTVTKFVEFVCLLVSGTITDDTFKWDGNEPEPIVISIQDTNKFNTLSHKRLSGFIKMKRPAAPIYAGVYTATPATGKNDKGTFGVFKFGQCGFVLDAKLYETAKAAFASFQDKEVDVTREPGDEPDFPHVPADDDPSGM